MHQWMNYVLGFGLAVSAVTTSATTLYPGQVEQPLVSSRASLLSLPKGFKATEFAKHLGRARHIAVRDNGDLYVSLRERHLRGTIIALRDTNNDGVADTIKYFGNTITADGTGIHVHENYLYVASETELYRYALTEGELVPNTDPEVVLKGFPAQHSHAAKPFVFDNQGGLYVNVGAPSNACQERLRTPGSAGQKPCPELELGGGIWRYPADKLGQQHSIEQRFATGVRHAVALDWHPIAKQLFLVNHGRDQLDGLWPDHYTPEQNAELPAEEFHRVNQNDDFGWPYTYYNSQTAKRMVAPEYGGDGKTEDTSGQYQKPLVAFPAHWAPNDLLFYTGSQFPKLYQGGAFIAFHGSWNRAPLPQGGYNIVFVPFDEANQPNGEWFVFAEGFIGRRSEVRSPGLAQHRPTGLGQDKQGALYISDSVTGSIWKIEH